MESKENITQDDSSADNVFQSREDREIDNPGLNQDKNALDPKDDENFDESDDFHKYDDIDHSNVLEDDPIAISNQKMNDNAATDRPTFNRTYDRNTAEDDDIEEAGRFDGTVKI